MLARTLGLAASDWLTLGAIATARSVIPWGYAVPLVSPAVAVFLGLLLAGSYGRGEPWRSPARTFAGAGLGVFAAGWISIVHGSANTAVYVAAVWIATGSCLGTSRWVLSQVVEFAKGRFLSPERVLLVGATEQSLDAIHAQLSVRQGMEVVGRLALHSASIDIWTALQQAVPDTVVLTGELGRDPFQDVVQAAAVSGTHLLSVSRYDKVGGLRPRVVWWGGAPITELSLPELTAPQLAVKRVVDVLGAVLGLIFMAPLLVLIAILIKVTSRGPVFFHQLRIGLGGRLFWMYKFRTMQLGADEMKDQLAHLNASGDPRLFKIPEDPRVTTIGRMLRRWSLDELPQLFNVLKGEMSLVGPRPFFEEDLENYRDEHFSRLATRPGITGLWQVRGRSSILDFEEVVRLDLEYVYRWSLVRDFLILMETVPAVLRKSGAV